MDEIETMGLEQATNEGTYDKAESNVKKVINGFLSKFDDYDIFYM